MIRRPFRLWSAFGVGCLVLLAGCPGKKPAVPSVEKSETPSAAGTGQLTAQDAAELIPLRTTALAHLENQQFAACEATLQTIRSRLPQDRFVLQNLAICRQLAVEGLDSLRDPAGFSRAVQAAESAIGEFDAADPRGALALLLRARVEVKNRQRAAAIGTLRQATQRDPDFAPAWYDLYQLHRESADPDLYRDPAKRAPLLEAGKQVSRLAPDNWFLWKDWVVDLARAEDAELLPLLERMRVALQPFAATIKRDVRVDPLTLIDAALKAWQGGQKAGAIPPAMTLRNIILLESAQDKAAISRHSLDFVVMEYSTKLPEPEATSTAEKPLELTFSMETVTLPGVEGSQIRAARTLDANVDGRLDLVVLTARRLQVFTQTNGTWSEAFGVDLPGEASAFLAADLDDDGDPPTPNATEKSLPAADPEFIVSGPGGLWVFENQRQADGSRQLILRDKDVPWANATDIAAVTLLDLDGDGDLDLFAGAPTPRAFIYRGNFLFGEITERSQLPDPAFRATAAVPVDWDRDVDVDLIVSSAEHGVAYFENIRHGRFRYHDLGPSWKDLSHAAMLNIADLNRDGTWDLVGATPQGTFAAIGQRTLSGGGPPQNPKIVRLSESSGHSPALADLDNDGAVDIVTNDTAPLFRRNGGQASFSAMNNVLPAIPTAIVAADDVDHDGDVDVWLIGETITLARNENGNQNHWIELRPRGAQEKGNGPSNSQRVNHQAIGSLVELRVGNQYQAAVVDGQSIRFGLGSATKPDALRIIWTNGVPRAILNPQPNQVLFEEFLPSGSCPYLYTWNGERFVFCTDLLWNAPLGLKFAEDVVAPWREWEYLKIDGDRLKPRGNEYVLQFTEELWEAAYFDQVQLMAIDHPAEVQVFTNEKVGPPEMAAPKLHTVTHPRLPLAARDPQGRDILLDIRERDDRFTKTMGANVASGLVPEHYLELDFGDLGDAKQVTLFLTGWMFPTDTSLNVQFSQNPAMQGPRPPSLWAPDAAGQWREVRPFLGFPGGKTKTIAVDVTDALTLGDARLRIVTNMEFYWDHAFVTVDEPSVAVKEQVLSLKHADLHFRGCSQAVYHPYNGPEFYDYNQVNRGQQWPPLSGKFTRYGDVTALLRERDDQLAVFGAGDEMTVTFALPKEPLPEGWVRDFVLYNVGWDKDAVLNTVHGATVEPLPYRAMKTYGNGDERPRDAVYEEYLRLYQTREQSPAAFWNQLRQGRQPVLPAARKPAP